MLIGLVALQQAQASATAAAIAAKPGCKSIIDLSGTSSSNPKSMSRKSSTSNQIAISFTVTSSQKLYFTGTNLEKGSTPPGSIYSSTACTSGNFSTPSGVTFSHTTNSTTLQSITVSTAGLYIFYYDYTSSSNEAAYIQ